MTIFCFCDVCTVFMHALTHNNSFFKNSKFDENLTVMSLGRLFHHKQWSVRSADLFISPMMDKRRAGRGGRADDDWTLKAGHDVRGQ